MKKVGIIGSGPVGKALAVGFMKKGYNVMVGSRQVSKLEDWKVKTQNVETGTFEDTMEYGDLLVLAVGGRYAKDVLSLGKANMSGKIIIDATNPISENPPENGVLQYYTNLNRSLMEELQEEFAESLFVKAFNSVGNAFMVDPDFKEGKPTMFICGNDENAKDEVSQILEKFGWESEDMGGAESARAIEPLAMLWCIPGFLRNQWSHAFKLLKK